MLRQARAAVLQKAPGRWINGAPLATLRALLVDVDADELLDAVRRAPDNLGVPRLVEWLECNAGVPELVDVAPELDPAAERSRLAATIANRRSMLAVYADTDADPELVDMCRRELVECENRLATLDQEGAA